MTAPTGDVTIEFPATTGYVALCRIAAAGLAGDLNPDVDEIEDLRIAVDELVTLLVESAQAQEADTTGDGAGSAKVRLHLGCEGSELRVVGSTEGASGPLEVDELTDRILEATADAYEIRPGGFTLRKRFGRA